MRFPQYSTNHITLAVELEVCASFWGVARLSSAFIRPRHWVTLGLLWKEATERAQVNRAGLEL